MPELQRIAFTAFPPEERPALTEQLNEWRNSQPFEGAKLLVATPVFMNTLVTHAVLESAGAELTIGVPAELPRDPRALEVIAKAGIDIVEPTSIARRGYDVVVDCAAQFRNTSARYGYVELTRSGASHYASARQPVVLVDASPIKRIETSLGTGDGFIRGLAHYGHTDLTGKVIAVFGGGKVGQGIAISCHRRGAEVLIIDDPNAVTLPPNVALVDRDDSTEVSHQIERAWCIVTATGEPAALDPWAQTLTVSNPLLANMGVADEFGARVPAERVLNRKAPLNFVLDEPTRLRYLDPVLALVNASALHVLRGEAKPGMHPPPAEIEAQILSQLSDTRLGQELASTPDLTN